MTATLADFKTNVAGDVVVRAETPRVLNFTLERGDVAETVTATANVPVLQTESASVAGTISEIQVRRLPQFGSGLL